MQSLQCRGARGSDFPGQRQVTLAQLKLLRCSWEEQGGVEAGEAGRLGWRAGRWGVPGLVGGRKAGRKRWRPTAPRGIRSAPTGSAAGPGHTPPAGAQVLNLVELVHKGHRPRRRGRLRSGGGVEIWWGGSLFLPVV